MIRVLADTLPLHDSVWSQAPVGYKQARLHGKPTVRADFEEVVAEDVTRLLKQALGRSGLLAHLLTSDAATLSGQEPFWDACGWAAPSAHLPQQTACYPAIQDRASSGPGGGRQYAPIQT